MFKEKMLRLGYSREEEFFYKVNQELIDRWRENLNLQRVRRREKELKELHWMRCPKCGYELEEIELSGIMVDRCTKCSGIYFDKGELDLLLRCSEREDFLGAVKRWFA